MSNSAASVPDNADIDRDTPQPEIHVEERKLSLHDFLKACVETGASDVHLQAGSVPMMRVDGRARFLDTGILSDEQMKEYVDQIMAVQGEPKEKISILEHKGAVDVAYTMTSVHARFRTNIFHSREKYA